VRTALLRLSSRQLEVTLEEYKAKAEGVLPLRVEGTSVQQLGVEESTVPKLEVEAILFSRREVGMEEFSPLQYPRIQMIRYDMHRTLSINDNDNEKMEILNINLRINDNQVLLPPCKVHTKPPSVPTALSDPILHPHEYQHQHQQQAPPSSSKSQTNPFCTSIHPKGDNRWPPPGRPIDMPIDLLEKYWYRLLHNNPAPEVSQLRKKTITRVNSAWQKYKREQKPEDDPRLFMIWAKNTSKMREIYKGPRGDVYLLRQDHEYVAGYALTVEGWEKEK
jgi:hypothetical protein